MSWMDEDEMMVIDRRKREGGVRGVDEDDPQKIRVRV